MTTSISTKQNTSVFKTAIKSFMDITNINITARSTQNELSQKPGVVPHTNNLTTQENEAGVWWTWGQPKAQSHILILKMMARWLSRKRCLPQRLSAEFSLHNPHGRRREPTPENTLWPPHAYCGTCARPGSHAHTQYKSMLNNYSGIFRCWVQPPASQCLLRSPALRRRKQMILSSRPVQASQEPISKTWIKQDHFHLISTCKIPLKKCFCYLKTIGWAKSIISTSTA